VQEIEAFKRQNGLNGDGEVPATTPDFEDDIDLRAEDDALIAAELEAAAAATAAAEAEEDEADEADEEDEDADEDAPKPAARRRGRRGGRTRRKGPVTLEGTFDHGEEGYGLWLDPAVQDDPLYAEHWAGHRPVEVTIEEDQIVIRRAGAADDDEE